MNLTVDVHIRFLQRDFVAGRLWMRTTHGNEGASFEYAEDWLAFTWAFALDPALPLGRGVFHTDKTRKIFSFLTDCMPDRWGRTLIMQQVIRQAEYLGKMPNTLTEANFLLSVNDTLRQGALRFTHADTNHFLRSEGGVPALVSLGGLLSASGNIQKNAYTDKDMQTLLEPGSSLGGARPKAGIQDGRGVLWIAKFPAARDDWDVALWEYVALTLAHKAGLQTPAFRLEKITGKNVLLVRRFDRDASGRIPFASAMTMLNLRDREQASYADIADVLRAGGSAPENDLRELWKRMIFNAAISNVDDHLRNHGFLRESAGWRLSPVYDLESTPPLYKSPRQNTSVLPGSGGSSLDNVYEEALAVSELFGVSLAQARAAILSIDETAASWLTVARAAKASKADIDVMAPAFATKMPRNFAKIHTASKAASA